MKVCSFDIFDTCLVRACGKPDKIFDIVARKVIKGATLSQVADFTMIRCAGESEARKRYSEKEITIEQIYDNCDFSYLTDLSNAELISVEIETERENLVAVSEVRDLICRKRQEGYKILYISDMYLPQSFLEEVLYKEGLICESDEIFVSSTIGKTKVSGELFEFVREKLGESITEWIHSGDNKNSDYKIPSKHNINAVLVNHVFSASENLILDNPSVFNNEQSNLVASICKAVRLQSSVSPRHEFAADYIAPLFVPFVYWVLDSSKQRGITDLYFVARDGCILYDIAQMFVPLFGNIRVSYIYMSRSSVYFPACDGYDEIESLLLSKANSSDDPYKVIENYTGLTSQDFPDSKNRSLKEILSDDVSRNIILEQHGRCRKLLLEYFKQEGLANTEKCRSAIVDLRGTGKSLNLINTLLSRYNYNTVEGFYLELTQGRNFGNKNSPYHAIVFGERISGSDKKISSAYALLESYFAAANHPRTLGYRYDDNDQIVPIFESDQYLPFNVSLYSIHRSVILSWVKMYILTFGYTDNIKSIEIGLSLLKYLFTKPEYKYLQVLSELVISDTGLDKENYVRNLTFKEVWYGRPSSGSFIWYDGSFLYTFGKYVNIVNSLMVILKKIRNVKRKISNLICHF